MPRRALRCVVDLNVQRVSAPGVWLPSREDLYISISVFGQYRNTRNVASVFPLILHEPFRFEKTYYTAFDPQDVSEFLEDELVVIELLQYSDYSDGAVRLASYSTSAREFLFPYPTLCPSYTSTSREALLSRTIAWPGISPKLEFTTKTVIKESRSPELDALEDALEEEKLARRARSRSRSRSRSFSMPRSLSRSRSRTRTCSNDNSLCISISRSGSLSSDSETEEYDSDPPYMRPTISSIFRSRNRSGLETSLIGRKPGAPATKNITKKKTKKVRSRPSSALGGYVGALGSAKCPVCSMIHCVYLSGLDCLECQAYISSVGRIHWGHGPNFHPTGQPCCNVRDHKKLMLQVIRDSDGDLPVYTTKYSSVVSDDDDLEVAELTSRPSYIPVLTRPRSASPYLYKTNYSSRFSRPVSPALSAADRLEIDLAVDRARSRARARALARSISPRPIRYSPSPRPIRYSPSILYGSIEDLALDTSVARNRRYYPRYL